MDSVALAGLITTALTELAQGSAKYLGKALPPYVKQLLALFLASGVSIAGLVKLPLIPILGPQGNQALSALVVWFVGMVAHDVIVAPAQPKKP